MRLSGRRIVALAMLMLLTVLAACGDDSDDGSTAGDGDGTAQVDETDAPRYDEALEIWYEGTYKEPEGTAVEAPGDKDIWFISTGMGIEYSVRAADAAKQAAEDLGWTVNVFDAEFDPNAMLTGVQQAVVAGADGIIVSVIDCDTVKNAAQQAADAGIPVVGIESADCDPGLYTHVVDYAGNQPYQDWLRDYGRAQAAWVIAETEGEANVVLNTGTDTEATRLMSEGQKAELDECPGCEVLDDVTWVGSDFGPALQEKIQQAMVKNPDANAFVPSFDAIMTQSGGAQALSSTGRLDQLAVGGGEGSIAGIEQIRSGGGMEMCAGQSAEWETYSAFDALIRLFLDRDPTEVDTGNGIQVCYEDHNLPPEGEAYTPPVDFVASYRELWGLA
jgi:ribose transport system substrate-binding protein